MTVMSATVLICEDDYQLRRLIGVVLRGQGYDLHEAAHGQAALDKLTAIRPDLAILDVQMPGVDGLVVLGHIREDPRLAETRVLLLSGSKEALDDDWGRRVGADAHLAKPFPVEELSAAVRSLLAAG
jgi:two-component system response regulator MtrA